jgi:DNA polymerase-3 subunit epsilon
MKEKHYAIVDLETTGGKASRDKIIEIGIVIHNGQQILDTFHSLINPECYIPYGITQLTGITQDMVQDAPKFYEIAKTIVEFTEGNIFVAHNVRFDYSFLREEFKRLGFTFSRKQLCTVRLSRKAFPGLPSYSLENMIRFMGYDAENRHRAMDDAMATAELLKRILAMENSQEEARALINLGVKEALLPKNFSIEKIHALPESCGVYYFHNQQGDVIYVGKSINIKKRIAEHFANKTEKASKLQQQAFDISYELTGSELIALLLESHEIKRLRPSINRAQRVRKFPYVISTYQNQEGYVCFALNKVLAKERKNLQLISEYPKLGHAKSHLNRVRENFELCGKLLGIDKSNGACFHYHIKQCHGACIGKESLEAYNERATMAKEALTTVFEQDFFIIDKGRDEEELGVVLVENGNYQGFGYLGQNDSINNAEQLREAIRYFPGNPETTRLIQRFLSKKNEIKIIPIS